MHEEDRIERRVERAVFETDRQIIVGDVTLPPAGYQSRFSDSLNRGDLEFVPLTNVEITSLIDGKVSERPFVVLNKRHVRLSYPYPRQAPGHGMAPPPSSAYGQPLS
jgi:uncharacterized protein DUF6812